jgi:hypothetical protein
MPQIQTLPVSVNPITGSYMKQMWEPPDIITFVTSPFFLNRPRLYPRQATLLKIIFLQDELFTDYDYGVIEEWSQDFVLNPTPNSDGFMSYEGYHGLQPDILERIRINKEAGRKWFKECVVAIGRRGSKGYLGALCGAYVIWHYMSWGQPQLHYGIAQEKPLQALIYAGKLNQAKAEQFGDLRDVILGSNCFAPYIAKSMGESLLIRAPSDGIRLAQLSAKKIKVANPDDLVTFHLLPKESTLMSGRGPTSFIQFYDEMAHVTKTTAKNSAEEVYGAATPSLDQFGVDGFLWEGSSTWQMMGQYYENWLHSLQVHYDTGLPVYPEMFMVQLESWDPYKDWRIAHTLPMTTKRLKHKETGELRPPKHFDPLDRAIQEYDEPMRRLEQANPETFKVERRSRWAASMQAYLNPDRIKMMWEPWQGQPLVMQAKGALHRTYAAHIDPSKSGANTGLAVGHIEGPDERGYHHVVFDLIKHWQPGDFPKNKNEIDYIFLEDWWNEYVTDAFMPETFTFDQFETTIIQRVNRYARSKQRPKSVRVFERTATKAINWKVAEGFKTALGLNLLHAPYYQQADLEMIYLEDLGNEKVDHPTMGPVQTKDVFDAMSNVVYTLIGAEMMAFLGQEFTDFGIQGAQQGGVQPFSQQFAGENSMTEAQELFSHFGRANIRAGGQMAQADPSRNLNRQRPTRWSPSSPWQRGR